MEPIWPTSMMKTQKRKERERRERGDMGVPSGSSTRGVVMAMLAVLLLGVGFQVGRESGSLQTSLSASLTVIGYRRGAKRNGRQTQWRDVASEGEDEEDVPSENPLLQQVDERAGGLSEYFEQLRNNRFHNESLKRPRATTSSFLPRTGEGEYNVGIPGERYMLYSPSGGFNNQLACLLSASYMARQYNRTLIVPANGKHSSMAWGYYALKEEDITPMDHALDFEFMSEKLGVKMMALNTTIKNYHQRYLLAKRRESNSVLDVIHAPKRAGFYRSPPSVLKNYLEEGRKSSKQYLWFEGRFYTKYWALKHRLYKYIRYSPYLRQLSINIAKEMFNGTFNAYHIRMGDYTKYVKDESANSAAFVSAGKRYGLSRDRPVYIATDGRKGNKYFKALKKHYRNIYFQTDLADNPMVRRWIQDFNRRVPKAARNDLFGLVEQMICVQARNYVGTAVSTFSQTIAKTRRSVRNAMPEIDANKIRISALIHWNGKLSYLKRAPDSEEDST